LSVAVVIVCLLLAEAGLAWFGLYPPEPRVWPGERSNRGHPHFVADARLGWRMRADVAFTVREHGREVRYVADADGRRTGPADAGVKARERTIVLAGDSFFWGAEVEYVDSIAAMLERRHPSVRVVNVAQPGYGVDQMMLSVVHDGLPLRPDLVVVGIYPNDCSRSHTAYRDDLGFEKPTFQVVGGALVPLTPADRPGALFAFLEHHSRVYGLWQRTVRNVGFKHGTGSWWGLNEAILDELQRAVAAAGSRLLVVHVPLHDWRAFGALSSWAQRRSVALIDPVQLAPVEPAGLYFEPDAHLTPAGHRWLADAINAWIERDGPTALR
jgi:hypothetical protein